MAGDKLISLVVPTSGRAETLEGTLAAASLLTDRSLEIIVGDNANIDGTLEVVEAAARKDPRIRKTHTDKKLSMRQNFELSLDACGGDYVIFMGDDDAPLEGGMRFIRSVIRRFEPDALGWSVATYRWPDPAAKHNDGVLTARLPKMDGGLVARDPAHLVQRYASASVANYREGVNIYHGCVSRRVIERAKAVYGDYFADPIPDVFTTQANLFFTESYLYTGNQLTISGKSVKSNGDAYKARGAESQQRRDVRKLFEAELAQDPVKSLTEVSAYSFDAHILAGLIRANQALPRERQVEIDYARWHRRIIGQLRSLGEAEFQTSVGDLRLFAARHGGWSADLDAHARSATPTDKGGLSDARRSEAGVFKAKFYEASFPQASADIGTVAGFVNATSGAVADGQLKLGEAKRSWIDRTIGRLRRVQALRQACRRSGASMRLLGRMKEV